MSIRTIDPLETEKIKASSQMKKKSTGMASKYFSKELQEIIEVKQAEKENLEKKQLAAELKKKKKRWILDEIMKREEQDTRKSFSPRPSALAPENPDLDSLSFIFEGSRIKSSEEQKNHSESSQKIQESDNKKESSKPYNEKVDPINEPRKSFDKQAKTFHDEAKSSFLPFERPSGRNSANSRKSLPKQVLQTSFQERPSFEKRQSKDCSSRMSHSKTFSSKYDDLGRKEGKPNPNYERSHENPKKSKDSSLTRRPEKQLSRKSTSCISQEAKKITIQRRSYSISSEFDLRLEDLKENETYKRENFGPVKNVEENQEPLKLSSSVSEPQGRAYIMIEEEQKDSQEMRILQDNQLKTAKTQSNLNFSYHEARNRPFNSSKPVNSSSSWHRPSLQTPQPLEVIDLTLDDESFPELSQRNPRISATLGQKTSDFRKFSNIKPTSTFNETESFSKSPQKSPSKRVSNLSSCSSNSFSDASNDSCITFNPFAKKSVNRFQGKGKMVYFSKELAVNDEVSEIQENRFGEELKCSLTGSQKLPKKRSLKKKDDHSPYKLMKKHDFPDDQNIRPDSPEKSSPSFESDQREPSSYSSSLCRRKNSSNYSSISGRQSRSYNLKKNLQKPSHNNFRNSRTSPRQKKFQSQISTYTKAGDTRGGML